MFNNGSVPFTMNVAPTGSANGGGFGNGMWNNPFMYLVWMYMMRWMNGNGEFGGAEASTQRQLQTLADQINDNHTSELLMSAIQGSTSAIQEVSTRLGCDINALASAV